MGKLFGTDGIRGEAGRYPLDERTTFRIGRALALALGRQGMGATVIVGRDTRESGPMLESALVSGVVAAGGVARLAGVLPTPGIALAAMAEQADAGVVLTASHNPYKDNGIKIFSGKGFKLSGSQEQAVERLVLDQEQPHSGGPAVAGGGRAEELEGADAAYEEFIRRTLPPSLTLKGVRIALDTANGATHKVAPAVFASLGADVSTIHDLPDGTNINEGCGSQHTEDLRTLVTKVGADIGLAFDGDGDRLIAVDERGVELTGDQALLACALMLRGEGQLRHDQIVSTIMSNVGLSAACKRLGIKNHAAEVGDRHVLEDMQRLGAVLGGEPSGHMIFLDHHTTGDGLLSGLQLVAAMLKSGKPVSELAAAMEVYPQVLINVEVKDRVPLDSAPRVVEAIREVEAELGDEGRVLVRYSGTQALCRVMVEGPDQAITQAYASRLAEVVKTELG